ncbi:MAG: response regulator [Geothrix sp.]|uniref:hybrid sensor histidine kinase/response regulator n=1 Tax=Geothrix sp. TaxID=1962974 RepID=UPI0017CCBD12|nr:response regulator [Geothrix sp.]NWJ40565.1 response regulator [Geothrix sp.]WIL21430.1 MAG: response regulator [Geothrix sp.]
MTSDSVQRRTRLIVWGISGLVTVLVPLLFFMGSHQYLRGVMAARTELRAREVSQLIAANPTMWRFEELRLTELLERGVAEDRSESVELVGNDGTLIARKGRANGALQATHLHDIYDAGEVVGRLRASYSLKPLLLKTLVVALGSLAFAFLVILVFRRLTLREVQESASALKESEQKYRSLYGSMKEGLAIHSVVPGESGAGPALTILDANPNCLAMFGLDRKAIQGDDSFAIFGAGLLEHRAELMALQGTEGIASFELAVPGLARHFLVQAFSPVQGQIATLFEDITQRKQSENERLNLERQLLHAQKLESLGILSGGIAHDFNNLLAALQGFLNLAQIQLDPGSPALRHLDAMEQVLQRAADLTRQMLAYSGRGRFIVQPHALNQIIQGMNDLVKVTVSKKITLRFDLALGLSPIEADAAQVQQVILNLLANASEAMGGLEGAIHVVTRAAQLGPDDIAGEFRGQDLEPGPYVVLEVSDTGCGMSPEVQARIFDPFYTTKTTGRGLGLSAILGILRGHRAGMQIDSWPGQGTRFRIYFRASAQPLAVKGMKPRPPRTRLQGSVLLVDDEEMIVSSVSDMLESMGLRVHVARDGRQAVALFQKEGANLDLVLMDITMPHMDGLEAFRQIHLLDPRKPVILSSGYTEHESIHDGIGEQAAGFLQKPYSIHDLYAMVTSHLGGRSRERPVEPTQGTLPF